MREYLDTLDDAAFGAATDVKPKFTAHSDPASQWTAARKGPAFFAFSNNYLIDTDHAVILDVEVSRSVRQAEVGAARTMIDRFCDAYNLHPERLIADTAYGTGPLLEWLVQKRGIAPQIPVVEKSERTDGTFETADFIYKAESDVYVCSGGKELRQRRRNFNTSREPKPDKHGVLRYRASKKDCDNCALKQQCCPKAPQRKVTRSVHEPSRDVTRQIYLKATNHPPYKATFSTE